MSGRTRESTTVQCNPITLVSINGVFGDCVKDFARLSVTYSHRKRLSGTGKRLGLSDSRCRSVFGAEAYIRRRFASLAS